MYHHLVKLLLLNKHTVTKVEGKVTAIKVHYGDISEAQLIVRMSVANPVKTNIVPPVYSCRFENKNFTVTFLYSHAVIQW